MTERTTDIQTRSDFNQVLGIINFHRQRVSKAVDSESLRMIWEVGVNHIERKTWKLKMIRDKNLCHFKWHKSSCKHERTE